MEERGVPVQDDWSIAPEDDRVRFSLSGLTPHSWGEREEVCEGQGPGEGGGHREGRGPQRQEATCRAGVVSLLSSLPCSPGLEGLPPRGGANFSQHILPEAQHLLGPYKDWSSGDTGHPAAVTREHPGFPRIRNRFPSEGEHKTSRGLTACEVAPLGYRVSSSSTDLTQMLPLPPDPIRTPS